MSVGPSFSVEEFQKESAKERAQLVRNVNERNAHFAQQGFSEEALAIGYRSGIKELTPLAQRVIELEAKVAELQKQLQGFQDRNGHPGWVKAETRRI